MKTLHIKDGSFALVDDDDYGDLATLNFLRGVTPARLPVSAPAPPPVAQPLAALPSPAAANSGGV